MSGPKHACERYAFAPGIVALAHGLLWLERSRALIAADAHLGYEDVIGGALPLWSTGEITAALERAIDEQQAEELVFLGDAIHGSRMNEGAVRAVGAAFERLRARVRVTVVAGNHEGRTRGTAILGQTHEAIEREGWMLIHGDKPHPAARIIVGHLHPSLKLGGDRSVPVFLGTPRAIVLPALNPYSTGLSALSSTCASALKHLGIAHGDCEIVAIGDNRLLPFGSVATLKAALSNPVPSRFRRPALDPD